jgi:membrane-associated phospholipid phosphatase
VCGSKRLSSVTAVWRRFLAAPALIIGLAVLAIGMVIVRNGTVSAPERSVFRTINDLPDWLYRPLWPFQQLGALAVGPVVAIVAAALRRFRLAIALLVATVAKLGSERLVKAIVSRQRPGTSVGQDVHLRGDVTPTGESFVSGHAVLVAAIAGLVTAYLPGRWKIVPWVVVAMVMLTRVYVGAHNPLDVVCGAGLGLAIAGVINMVMNDTVRGVAA